ncbi:hypothetical protein [Bosea sp. (in: a-proteobacteria)]|jgi:hypothetical protein|uniref:hypothetical protein n=1 Tax=Bosea sp. (in: a-proteobacteria) TaxID=1871050 RepID=UPI00086F80C1|nr:hypothetical protein [Bosea sp. (in: a-proteobacteria)]MBN9439602.1 hypothetical protein [Bosea sp. (in: a-proteobacteria)]ODT19628.1 MAG: hypothetical protein ABS35_21300 [Kaistia sp. SCN 65-12]
MTNKEWLDRLAKLEREQIDHYRAGRASEGDAVGLTICSLISEGRAQGFCVPDGRPPIAGSAEAGRSHG